MGEMFEQDVPKRLNDPAIRKVFFITTDGCATVTPCPSNIDAYLKMPITFFAIGSKVDADYPTLLEMANYNPDHAKRYADFPQFAAELPSLLYETCQIGSHVVPVGKHPSGGFNTASDETIQFSIAGMLPGDTRYFNFNITEGSTNNLKVTPKSVNIKMYASFTNLYPSEVSYDFKTECNAGTQCSLVVKHPAQFASAVCVQNLQGTKQYTVAVIATGGSGPENLTANNVVGANKGGDYSSPDLNGSDKPSKKQVIVQSRMGLATKAILGKFVPGIVFFRLLVVN